MFLLTIVLILISMLGVYTQVYALEAARLLASQTSLASTLVNWHTTAATVAANAMQANSAGAGGSGHGVSSVCVGDGGGDRGVASGGSGACGVGSGV